MVTQTLMGNTSVPESSLSRQGSFYGLTLDEVQNQLGNLGKPLGSMNLDELLRTVWSGEAIDNGFSNTGVQVTADSPLSKKTVEEVWREIQQGKKKNDGDRNQERQNTLGEMTLEDFLAQAGVVVEKNGRSCNNFGSGLSVDVNVAQNAQWVQYQMVPHGYYTQNSEMTPSPLSDTQTPVRKRVAQGGMVERTVERRQKRMIKNRESAARSRARKQAYTQELENKVSQLEVENERLRRMKENQEMEKALPRTPPPEPKYQLRRTRSAPL